MALGCQSEDEMQMRHMIKAGLLTSTLLGLAAPAIAQQDEHGRGHRESAADTGNARDGQRGNGDNGNNGNNARESWNNDRQRPVQAAAAPVAAPPPVAMPQRAAPPVAVAAPAAGQWNGQGREQRGYVPRPGTPGAQAPVPATPPVQNVADNRGHSNGGGQQGGGQRDGGQRGGGPQGGGQRDGGQWDHNRGDQNANDRNRDRGGNDRDWGQRGNDRNRDGRDWNNRDNRDNVYRQPPRVENRWQGQRRWDNNGWRQDRRYDWQDWRRDHRSVYRLPRYSPPYGWYQGYYRFSIGAYLSSLLFENSYWIDDPFYYRLPPAYGPFRWVRYYNDALLVDTRDGYVVDIVYDVFW